MTSILGVSTYIWGHWYLVKWLQGWSEGPLQNASLFPKRHIRGSHKGPSVIAQPQAGDWWMVSVCSFLRAASEAQAIHLHPCRGPLASLASQPHKVLPTLLPEGQHSGPLTASHSDTSLQRQRRKNRQDEPSKQQDFWYLGPHSSRWQQEAQ